MKWIKKLWRRWAGWRTIVLNGAIAIGFALAEILSYLAVVDWRSFIPEQYAPWVVVAINVLNIIMHHITVRDAEAGAPPSKVG